MFLDDSLVYQNRKVAVNEDFNLSESAAGQEWLKSKQFIDSRTYKSIQFFYRQKSEESYLAA